MELSESSLPSMRFPDDRSDSGVSSLRSSSGDERSGSRSSALSAPDEPPLTTNQSSRATRSPLFITTAGGSNNNEPVRVWRDPALVAESEPQIRHVHSVQHRSLLMSHPPAPGQGPPPSTAAAALYPPPPSLMAPHPALQHPAAHLQTPPTLYHPHHQYTAEMMWKQSRYPIGAHLLPQPQGTGHPVTEELLERERALLQDRERLIRQSQEAQKERIERDKLEREQREREKQEKERQEQAQALQNHFEKSLRAAQQKLQRDQRDQWTAALSSRTPQTRPSEEDRKRAEELHQRDQRHTPRNDTRDGRSYYQTAQRPPSVPTKVDYPPAAHSRSNSGKNSDKTASLHPTMQKSDVNMYGYPAYHPQQAFFAHEAKSKSDHHNKPQSSGLVVTKTSAPLDRDREILPNPPPLLGGDMKVLGDMKSTVIVKHDGKNSHHLEPRVSISHSSSPKLRTEPMMGHYLQSASQPKTNLYEYRSPTQSPHHLQHTPSPHHHMESKSSHHRSSQLPSPHQQRHSPHPHPHSQQHPSPELRYRSTSESQSMAYPTSTKSGFPYLNTTVAYTHSTSNVSNSKPKVSSPAPHHIYGKPTVGIVAGIPTTRPHETAPIQLTAKPPLSSSISPSPYQQVSQYQPPHPPPMITCQPPPAHSSRMSSLVVDPRSYERPYQSSSIAGSGSGSSMKPTHHSTSPPTAATSSPQSIVRTHPQYMPATVSQNLIPTAVQTQPLDLGVSSTKYETSTSPKRKGTPIGNNSSGGSGTAICLEAKKRRTESPVPVPQPQVTIYGSPLLARVSEPSPLMASAATTITTVVNTAACRTSTPTILPNPLVENQPEVCVTPASLPAEGARPASTDSSQRPASAPLSSSPMLITTPVVNVTSTTPPVMMTLPNSESPSTSVKATPPPSVVDSEKSNSPGPNKSSSGGYPVRHLKKAWLQRHTGEDMEDTTGIVGSGSCVTLPLNINSTPANNSNNKEHAAVNSLHSIGSMAVNSISKVKHFTNKSKKTTTKDTISLNGHPADSTKGDDSSSSDQDRGRKSPPKRKPPKVKRKKGGTPKKGEEKKRKTSTPSIAASESGSDSEKESGSEKDSDSGASTTLTSGKKSTNSNSKEPRKRGRRPKSSKNDKGEESRSKKSKDDGVPQRDPFRKPPVGQLKKTGESFLQDGPCFEVAPKLAKCRECRWTPNQRSKNMPNIFCRFYAFRRLRYTKNGQLAIAGFSDPHKDATEEDLKLWLPSSDTPPEDLDLDTSRFLLKQVGDHFCDLLVQERDAKAEHMSEEKVIAWKRVVQGVREMCDVCETTLFNFHWACGKCGFVVCLDCYKSRKSGNIKVWGEPGKDRDEFSWLQCTNRQAHEQEKLMLTQIIAGDSLLKLGKMVHEMRELWNIEQYCACSLSKEVCQKPNNVACKEIVKSILMEKLNGVKKEMDEDGDVKPTVNGIAAVKEEKPSSLSWLADVALNEDKKNDDSSSDSDESSFSTLRELLIRPSHKPNGSRSGSPVPQQKVKKANLKMDTLDDVISSVIEDSVPKSNNEIATDSKSELKHFVRRYNWQAKGRQPLPIRIMTLTESTNLYPTVPHGWLCDGKLLRLSDPLNPGNSKIFQDQWKRGQPVIISDVTRSLNNDLWNPDSFARDFGEEKNDLINCTTGNVVPNQPMRKFWEGFEHFSKRLKDDRGNPMLLKLKDWPPGEDFAEMLPSRFNDLMKVLPLPEYTHRTGKLNLASRLPDCFVRPDLGPKMYNAYGSALFPSKGTTNLHLDISDAVNVMVYVGIPKDGDSDEQIKEAFRAIDEAGCDILTRRRVRDKGELPGALWHIYNARDADKIRDLLNKVVVEKGGRLEPHHDPIHDQSCYLDVALRERLYKEYGVEGYAIVQCLGDAVFIPAGAPHQVRNLHNCIKVAEDFVSPENVSHCFHLTQEFRDLSDTHSNHEDKLQIKNIIYHAVKESLSTLSAILNKHLIKSEKDLSDHNGSGEAQNSNTDSSEAV